MAFALAISGLLLLLVGFVSILVPLKFLHIRTRKMAAMVLVAGLVLSAIAGTMFGDKQALQAGFDNSTDYFEAKELGLSAPDDLAQHRAKQAEARRHAAEIAERTAVENGGFASIEEYRTALAGGFHTKSDYDKHLKVETFFRIPARQQAFVEAVESARHAYNATENDLAKGGTRNSRKQAVCTSISSRAVDGWIGRIADLSSNEDGKGVLEITLNDHIALKTWNNAFSDIAYKTLIEPGTPIFRKLMSLKEGDRIRFSGSFFQSDIDCFHEASMTLDGSMENPEYIMRFSAIETP